MLLYNKCLYVRYLLYPFTSIHLFGVTKNGSSHSFKNLFIFIFSLFHILISFFNLTQCLWFDLHRHLFLLVLFLLCGCDYNQEMEIQKSTCCHSKYVLFHLLTTLLITLHPPQLCLVIYPLFFSLHGFTSRAALCSELTNPFSGVWDCSVSLNSELWISFMGLMGVISELLPLLYLATNHCFHYHEIFRCHPF